MYDPIPWFIDEIDARRRGLARAGWYVMAFDGNPVVGPHDDPEGCIMALAARLPKAERSAAARSRIS
jgi:hypothetical protein